MATDPCTICGSPVRITKREMPRTLGQTKGDVIEVRVCTTADCRSNTGQRLLGETV